MWNRRTCCGGGIRTICRRKLMDNIFCPLKKSNEWKVLIVDDLAMSLLSVCFKTEEVMACNIALIESLEKIREPLTYLSAIYILNPTPVNTGYLISDFSTIPQKYDGSHLFFLSTVRDDLFKELCNQTKPGTVRTFKEIDLLFLPYESQVYSLSDKEFFPTYFDAYKEVDIKCCQRIAKRLTTLFSTLGEIPVIRYRRGFIKNLILAEAIQRELSKYQQSLEPSSSDGESNKRCHLLILDRGFDCISPVLHEFTLQAMAYDILDIKDDIYESATVKNKEAISLTEDDTLWCSLRHEHIANVAKIVENMVETNMIVERNQKASLLKKLPSLGDKVRKLLLSKKSNVVYIYKRMASECMNLYCSGINVLSDVEQNLALGKSADEKPIKDSRATVMNVLSNESFHTSQRLRVLLLYIYFKKGISKSQFDEIVQKSGLPFSEACVISNVLHLDIDLFRPGYCVAIDKVQELKTASDSSSAFKQSRWVPAVKNIIMNCIEDSLSEEHYPFLNRHEHKMSSAKRVGYWCADKKFENASRLVVFIAGGVTYSEMRCAYEVVSQYKGWEVFIGGDCLLTPNTFLDQLRELKCFISKDG